MPVTRIVSRTRDRQCATPFWSAATIRTAHSTPIFPLPSLHFRAALARTFGEEVWKLTVLELAFSIGMMLAGATIGVWGKRFSRTHTSATVGTRSGGW